MRTEKEIKVDKVIEDINNILYDNNLLYAESIGILEMIKADIIMEAQEDIVEMHSDN